MLWITALRRIATISGLRLARSWNSDEMSFAQQLASKSWSGCAIAS